MKNIWFFTFALLLLFSNFQAYALPNANGLQVYDISPLVTPTGTLTLLGGTNLKFSAWTGGSKVIFEDLKPGTNWEHPAKYLVLSPENKTIESITHRLPPLNLEGSLLLSGRTYTHFQTGINLNDFKGELKVKNPENFWAFLINGSAEQRHWNDFAFLYRVLKDVYGYLPSRIIVADSVFVGRNPDLDGDGASDIQYPSTVDGVKTAIQQISMALDEKAQILLVVNDHGGRIDGESTVFLYDQEIKASAFVSMLSPFQKNPLISVYGQCNSGGFVRPTTSLFNSWVAMSASTDLEISWATTNVQFDEFLYWITSAFAMQTHEGTPVKSDLNGDGRISVSEAFSFAVGHDKAPESPLLEAPTNSGKSHFLGMGF